MAFISPESRAENWRQQDQVKDVAKSKTDTAHGSARFASPAEIAAMPSGPLLLGRSDGKLLTYGGEAHLLTFAPTGSGKSVSVVVPNLMDYPGSVVCIDPKGAIAPITAAHRAAMGHDVVLLDPFGEVENAMNASGARHLWGDMPRSTFSPFSQLDKKSPYIVDDVRVIAGSLIVSEDSKNRFFSDSARAILEGFLLYLLATRQPERITIQAILDMAFDTDEKHVAALLKDMRHYGDEFGGRLRRLASQINGFMTGEMGASVWATLQQNLGLLDTTTLRDVLKHSTLDFRAMKDKKTTVYLVLPAHALETHGVWLRLMIAVIMRQLSDARPSLDGYPVLFMVDECATLGRLEILETAVGLMRGYGMKLWLIWQDLPQLQNIYGDRWSSFISNSGVKQFFNVNDSTTAEFLSQYLDKETLYTLSESISVQGQAPGANIAATGRALLTPDEVRRLGENEQILLYERQRPIRAAKLRYYEDPKFKEDKSGKSKDLFARDPYIPAKS